MKKLFPGEDYSLADKVIKQSGNKSHCVLQSQYHFLFTSLFKINKIIYNFGNLNVFFESSKWRFNLLLSIKVINECDITIKNKKKNSMF